jgi:protein involved in polysaccharide export with SLBB domain
LIEPPDVLRVEYSGGPPALKEVLVGEHLVRPDGTVGLATYGSVSVAGLTPEQARRAIARKLRETFPGFDDRTLKVTVAASNSKVYYVIAEDDHGGEQVVRLPLTGNDTVLDALSQSGLAFKARGSRIWVSRPPQGKGDEEKVLPVDWAAITRRGAAATNYQLLPGDRIYVRADPTRATRDTRDSMPRGREAEQAEKDFRAAEFYRRTGRSAAADFYYEMVRRRYPGTTEAARAEERLRGLRKEQRPAEALPGAPAKVGRILIVGNVRTPDEVLLWAFPLSPGDEFREADLQEGEHALNRLARGVAAPSKRFRATVELAKPYRSGEVTDIVISVKE